MTQIQNQLVKYSDTRQVLKEFTALNQTNTWNIVYEENFLLNIKEEKLDPWNRLEYAELLL